MVAVDQLFQFVLATMIAREVVVGRNWKNLKVLVPVSVRFGGTNVLFHVEALTDGVADTSRRLGIALLIFLIILIGGRIVPSFTRNGLTQRGRRGCRSRSTSLTVSALPSAWSPC